MINKILHFLRPLFLATFSYILIEILHTAAQGASISFDIFFNPLLFNTMAFIYSIIVFFIIEYIVYKNNVKMREFIDSLPIIVGKFKKNGDIIYLNNKGKDYLHLNSIKDNIFNVIEFDFEISPDEESNREIKIPLTDGSYDHFYIKSITKNNIYTVVAIDMSDVKKSQDELHKKIELYYDIINKSPSGILIKDYMGKIIFINEKAKKIFNISEKEIGKNISNTIAEPTSSKLNTTKNIALGTDSTRETKIQVNESSYIYKTIPTKKNILIGYITDITKQDALEKNFFYYRNVLKFINKYSSIKTNEFILDIKDIIEQYIRCDKIYMMQIVNINNIITIIDESKKGKPVSEIMVNRNEKFLNEKLNELKKKKKIVKNKKNDKYVAGKMENSLELDDGSLVFFGVIAEKSYKWKDYEINIFQLLSQMALDQYRLNLKNEEIRSLNSTVDTITEETPFYFIITDDNFNIMFNNKKSEKIIENNQLIMEKRKLNELKNNIIKKTKGSKEIIIDDKIFTLFYSKITFMKNDAYLLSMIEGGNNANV